MVQAGKPFVIPDTLADPAHAANPAARENGVRFYAGAPLLTADGHAFGTLCVLDTAPRPEGLTPAQKEMLQALARQVVDQFELRRTLAQQAGLLAGQEAAIRERAALGKVQTAFVQSGGDLDRILAALVEGALEALPAAEGAVLEMIQGEELEYRQVAGTLKPHRGLQVPLHGSLAGACALANASILVDDAQEDARVARELVGPLQLRAAVLAPIARGDQVLGVLKLQSSRPGVFGERERQLVSLFAGTATAGSTEVRAAEAQRAAAAGAYRLRAIFESATEVAIIGTDPEGRVTDWNIGAERILGWSKAEMRGETAERFFTPEDRANGRVATEMRLSLEEGRASDERWHLRHDGARFWASGEMMPLRSDAGEKLGFIKVLRDRTSEHLATEALKESEAQLHDAQGRRAALLDLSDRLSGLTRIVDLTDAACVVLGETSRVELVGYGLVDPAAETITVERDWTTSGAQSLAGVLNFRDYGRYIEDLKRGETVVVSDARIDPRTSDFAPALEAKSARAFVNTPVFENGVFQALLYVSTSRPRVWEAFELEFIREVASRTRAATARRQAEIEQRASEAQLRLVADALPLLVAFVDRSLTYRFANAR